MSGYWRCVLAVYAKDLRLELRTRDTILTAPVFALLVVVIFNFAFDLRPQVMSFLAPGVLWTAFVFAGVLALSRSFIREKDRGTLEGLLLPPVGRDAILGGKLLGAFTIMVLVEALLLPVFAGLYDVSLARPLLIPIMLLATVGFAAVGTTFSALAVNTRAREVLLPILFLPVVLPVVIAAVVATAHILEGGGWGAIDQWFALLVAYDAIFLVLSLWVAEFVMEE